MGAVDGVKDYIFAAAKDPTNYLGLITGGVARAGVAGVSLTGKQVVRSAVREAGRKALQDGASKKAAVEAAKKAGKEAAARAIKSGTSKRQAERVADGVVNTVEKDGRRFIAQEAMRKKQSELFESAAKRSLKQTIALDAGAAVLQDVMAQTAYIEAGRRSNTARHRLHSLLCYRCSRSSTARLWYVPRLFRIRGLRYYTRRYSQRCHR